MIGRPPDCRKGRDGPYEEGMTITLYETFRAVFYTPFYAALAKGDFAAEGLDVRLRTAESLEVTAGGALGSDADVSWGGPMRLLFAHDRDPASALMGFCEVVTRDPFFLVARPDLIGCTLADLPGLRLGVIAEVPTPFLCLQEDLRHAGIDPASLTPETNNSIADNVAAFRAGALDVIQVPEPWVEILTREGAGHVMAAAAARGPTAYTTLFAARSLLTDRRAEMLGMTRAVYRTQTWLHGAEPADIAASVQTYFPEIDPDILSAAIARYRGLGIWGKTPLLDPKGFAWLRQDCLKGGLIARGADYEMCVDTTLAADSVGML